MNIVPSVVNVHFTSKPFSDLSVALSFSLGPFFSVLVKGPELGAQPSVYLAVAEELEGLTGRYYDVMTEKEPAPQALDEEVARRLWEVSARLVGLEEEKEQSGSKPMPLPADTTSTAPQTQGQSLQSTGPQAVTVVVQ